MATAGHLPIGDRKPIATDDRPPRAWRRDMAGPAPRANSRAAVAGPSAGRSRSWFVAAARSNRRRTWNSIRRIKPSWLMISSKIARRGARPFACHLAQSNEQRAAGPFRLSGGVRRCGTPRCPQALSPSWIRPLKSLGEQLRREHNLELNAWVGLHTGPAIVETTENAVTLVGEARTVALRLEDAASPGEVVCSDATHRLLRGQFRCTSLGSRKVKGAAQPIEVFRVEGIAAAPGPIGATSPGGAGRR